MKEIKGCIFDLDGVICDTAKYHFLAWKRLANRLNIPFDEERNELLKGVSRMESLDILLNDHVNSYSQEEKVKMATEKNQWYVEYIKQMTKDELNIGVMDFINSLKKDNIKISLGSASKNAPLILERLEIKDLFDAIVDGNIVANAKPDPEVFTTAAKLIDLPYDNCIVFEDAVAGVEAAHRANMKCVGVGSPETLSMADYIIPDFKDFSLSQIEFK